MVDTATLTTYGGWAGIAAVAGGYWYLQRRKPAARPATVAQTIAAKAGPIKKDAKQKIEAAKASLSSAESEKATAAKKKNAKKTKNKETKEAAAPTAAAPRAPVEQESDDEDSGEIDNKEFARQLSQAKSGLQMGARPAAAGGRQKSVKQSRANTNGFHNDADDSSSSDRYNSGGVADMLEAPGAGPSSIRITAPTNAQPQKQKKAAKAPELVETKKQRQNRKKREAEQEMRAEAEAARKVEEEKQRRTARIAEGRAAKDGSASMAKAAAASVWKGPESQSAPITNGHVEVLDTFEQPRAAPQKQGDYSSLPSEEEQMRQLQQEDSWQSVPSKKSKVKKASSVNNDENVRPTEAAAPTPITQAPGSTYRTGRDLGQIPVGVRGPQNKVVDPATFNNVDEEIVWQM